LSENGKGQFLYEYNSPGKDGVRRFIFLRNDDEKPFIGDNTGEALLQVSEVIYSGALEY